MVGLEPDRSDELVFCPACSCDCPTGECKSWDTFTRRLGGTVTASNTNPRPISEYHRRNRSKKEKAREARLQQRENAQRVQRNDLKHQDPWKR